MKSHIQQGLIRIGLRIRQLRKHRGLTLAEVAGRAEISKGLLSRIENFRALPSLPVLLRIGRALRVDLSELLKGIELSDQAGDYVLVRAGDRDALDRDEARGFLYEAITCQTVGAVTFDSFVLTLSPDAQRKPVTTEGEQFIYVLKGSIDFVLGDGHITLAANDALFFDGRIPHVPFNTGAAEAQIIAIYLLRGANR